MKMKLSLISLLVVLAMLLGACQPAATPTTAPAEPTKAVEPTQAPKPTEAPTQPPAAAATATTAPATTGPKDSYTLTVTLKEGLKWSDGTAFTTKDILGTYDIFWAQNDATWSALTDVVVVDERTVNFVLKSVSPRIIRFILRANIIRPYAPYAEYMDKAHEMRLQGLDKKGDEVKAFLDELYAFKPNDYLVSGPYKIDPASVTEAQMTLVKNENGYNSGKIDFDTLTMFYGETNQTVPLVLSGDVDYSSHGFTPANIIAFQALPNVQIIRGPTGTGPGLWFNQNDANLAKKEVRQAFAYIIDRAENAEVSLGESGRAIEYMAGFTDLQVPTWMSEEAIAKLNKYEKDLTKAEELLTSISFKKGADGIWLDADGKKFSVELSVPSDFADWFASAENAADQLKQFGIDASVRGYQSSERPTVQSEGKYQILVDLAIYYNPPHPQTSFNYYLNTPRNNPNDKGEPAGFNWSFTQKLPDGTEVNVLDLINEAGAGTDAEAQKPAIEKLALLVNEELPVLAFFERFTNDPINTASVTGWLPLEDKIYKNNQGGDNYVAIQLLDGSLKPADANDKTFATSYPYPQPPKGHFNLFATDSIPTGLGTVYYPIEFPPLFWYMMEDATYVPVLAESWELK